MAAYAALVSLVNIMEQIKNHPRLLTSFDKYQIQSLRENVDFLLDFIETNDNSHGGVNREAADLEIQIVSAAYAAEDVIEYSIMVCGIRARSTEKRPNLLVDLQMIIEDMDFIKEKVVKVKEERAFEDQHLINYMPTRTAISKPPTNGNPTMVGFDGYLIQLLEWITGQQLDRKIIPIVGMGGIGKTTLARNVYENLLIVKHFDVRAWVTVSQEYDVREILIEVLSCMQQPTTGMDMKTEDELGEQLHKILCGRRYLVILDDIWGIAAWNKIKIFFPENYNRSRIVVTTRLLDMASQFGSLRLEVNFLNEHDSWDLFCEKAFVQEGCPHELLEMGKEIVKKCRGLPLSIVVIGGLLGKSSRKQENWEKLAKDISLVFNSAEDDQWLNVLSLSYSHLPVYLKPCFLYLGIFPEDHLIRVSQLIKLWIAEGFLKPNKSQSLEEIAEGHVKDLVDRNLLLVHHLGSNGRLKTCKIHDLLRDLCRNIAEKEKFVGITRVFLSARNIDREGRIVICEGYNDHEVHPRALHSSKSASLALSLSRQAGGLKYVKSRLLRVLHERYHDSFDTIFQQVNVRFLAYESSISSQPWLAYELSSSVSQLWNVQTLIVKGIVSKVVAPAQIWEMRQLRHLEFYSIHLPDPDPPSGDEKDDGFVLQNLHTLQMVLDFKCSEEVCKRIPNIRKLHILYEDFSGEGNTSSCYYLHNLGRLDKLGSLKYCFGSFPNRDDLLQSLPFPSSLKKLALQNCRLHWSDLTVIGSLPNLEVLKLEKNSVAGPEWSPNEGEFLRLKFLKIFSCQDIICWNAERSHFPVLENLVLQRLYGLDEIPSGIGEIPTLRSISISECSISAAISAIKIVEEQESFGNEGLQVRVKIWDERGCKEFKNLVDVQGFTTHNFQISSGLETL
ncbi:hypothetical protein C2S52_001733 [Perilla frutescens var. hirtella]|nr:hypothetical protein C2S51_006817 [Perilla frutescens var. frutescens]KAH6801269.1 hypothetical protein C2S52_001733 [Perilla frutescens var. hirtella]